MPLRDEIDALAVKFAEGILAAIRGSSLEELVSETSAASSRPGKPVGRPRSRASRSAPKVETAPPKAAAKAEGKSNVSLLVEAVHATEGGLSSGQLMEILSVSRTWLGTLLKQAMAMGAVRKTGQSKATRYVAG